WLYVLQLQGLAQQRVVEQVDLRSAEIIRRAPPGIDISQGFRGQNALALGSCHLARLRVGAINFAPYLGAMCCAWRLCQAGKLCWVQRESRSRCQRCSWR